MKRLYSLLIFLISFGFASAKAIPADSIGVRTKGGIVYVLHKVEAKETFYSLARKYKVRVNEIMEANKEMGTALNLGDTVWVPTAKKAKASSTVKFHKVKPGETLYKISKTYDIPVGEIKSLNNLKSNDLEPGQMLALSTTSNAVQKTSLRVVEPKIPQEDMDFNRVERRFHDVIEVEEEGLVNIIPEIEAGVLKKQALHRDAPIGSVVKITNKMTQKYVYVKVVGRVPSTAENHNVVIIISQSAADFIGAKQPFLGKLRYGKKLN